MTRKTWIYPSDGSEPVEKDQYMRPENNSPLVMPDIQPYRSMINGDIINSRSVHRAHLKAHNCIEIGNETKYLTPKPVPMSSPKETIIRLVNEKLRS